MAIDLDAYFHRIGYDGERTPTLETLRSIVRLHPQAIPYENLNTAMNWPVLLDAPSLERKLVLEGRGGYCYEQNLLLSHVLKALGFHVRELSARATWRQSEDAPTPRTHAFLHVLLDGQDYLVDVGYGIATTTAPLRLVPDEEQPTPHEPWKITRLADNFVVKIIMSGEWIPLYRFDLQEQLLSDFELMNWYTATNPKSLFVNNLLVARPDEQCRHSLLNNTYTRRVSGDVAERRTLGSAPELRDILENVFHLTLPDAVELDAALDRFAHHAKYTPPSETV